MTGFAKTRIVATKLIFNYSENYWKQNFQRENFFWWQSNLSLSLYLREKFESMAIYLVAILAVRKSPPFLPFFNN